MEESLDDDTEPSIAIWHEAVKELEKSGYIEACGPSREQFRVIGEGYKHADLSIVKK